LRRERPEDRLNWVLLRLRLVVRAFCLSRASCKVLPAGCGIKVAGAAVGNGPGTFPPTPAMKRFADSLVRQKSIKPPPGYKTSISICRKFLNEHVPKKADGEATGKNEPKPVSPAQLLYAKKIAQGKGLIIPDEAKANSAAMSTWIDSNRSAKRRKCSRKNAYKPTGSVAPRSTATIKRSRKRRADTAAAPPASTQPDSVTGTPLRISYGNNHQPTALRRATRNLVAASLDSRTTRPRT
jgi:DNA topoisomerase III